MNPPDSRVEQRRKAFDTLSAVGAGVAGIGLGVFLPATLKPMAGWLLATGLAAHLWGMVGRHRMDRQDREPAWWETVLYWGCWAAILGFGLYAGWRVVAGSQGAG